MRRSWWIVPAVWAADFISKQLAMRMRSPMLLVPGVVGLRYVHNSGMAFSLLSGHPRLLGVVSRNWKIDPRDRFGLLMVACHDCIGSVCIREVEA